MATVPTVPVEAAGTIAASTDLNAWRTAAKFLYLTSSGNRPVFFLPAQAAQSISSNTLITYTNTGPLFKDNDGGWSGGSPGLYTVQTPGFWSIDWVVSAVNAVGQLTAFAEVVTTSSNPYNPSVTLPFQYTCLTATSSLPLLAHSSGLCPIYLYTGDVIKILASASTTGNTSPSPYPQLTGQWVSA